MGCCVGRRPNKKQFDFKDVTISQFCLLVMFDEAKTKASTLSDYSNKTPKRVIYCD